MTKISIIIPIYNVEKYLPLCFESLISQTLKEIEIICINDGSTDNSLEVVKKYAQIDSRIKIITQDNQGVSEARNAGISIAQGEYLGMVDPDDWIEPNMFEVLYNKAKKKNADIVECDLIEHRNFNFDNKKIRKLKIKCNVFTNIKIKLGNIYNWKNIKTELFNVRAYCWNKIYRTNLIKNNINFEGRVGEDYYFCIEAFLAAKKIVYINKNLYHYVKRENSLSSGINETNEIIIKPEKLFHNFNRMKNIINKYGIMPELKEEFSKYLIKHSYIQYLFISRQIKKLYKNFLSEKEYIELERKIMNFDRNFLENIFSISTEASIDNPMKKFVILGTNILLPLSKK